MSSIHSVTVVFSRLIPSSDGYSSGQERVWEDRQTSFLDNITAKVGEEQRRKERREAGRGRGSWFSALFRKGQLIRGLIDSQICNLS